MGPVRVPVPVTDVVAGQLQRLDAAVSSGPGQLKKLSAGAGGNWTLGSSACDTEIFSAGAGAGFCFRVPLPVPVPVCCETETSA